MIIKLIPNFFEKKKKIEQEWKHKVATVREVFDECFPEYKHKDFTPSVSGKVVEWDEYFGPKDDVVFIQNIEGGGGIVSTVLGAVLTVVGVVSENPYLIGMGISMMVGGVVGMMFAATVPDTNTTPIPTSEMSDSKTYSWSGIQNIIGEGNPIPIVYGIHRIGGIIIEAFIHGENGWGQQENKILNVLTGLSEGPIEKIDTDSIQINKKEIAYYNEESDAVEYDFRQGENTQETVAGFNKIARQFDLSGMKLTAPTDDERDAGIEHKYQYYKTSRACDEAKVMVSFPALYHAKKNGGMTDLSVKFAVSYAVYGTDDYSTPIEYTATNSTKSQCDYAVYIPFPTKDKYMIRVERITDNFTSLRDQGDSYVSRVVEFENVSLTYPNTALLGYRFLATDKLSGSMPDFTVVAHGKKVYSVRDIVDNGDGTYTYGELVHSQNPADILFDLLTNKRFGLGRQIDISNIHLESFQEWAEFCDELIRYTEFDSTTGRKVTKTEKRFDFNFVIDKEYKAHDLISKICSTCRAIPMWEGDKFKVVIERAAEPVQLFTMDNIVEDSFQETYIGIDEIPNQIEAEILDEDDDFDRATLVAVDKSRLDEPLDSKKINFYGLTKRSRAKRELAFNLRKSLSARRMVEFQAGMDAIICECGDLVAVQYGYPEYGLRGITIEAVEQRDGYFLLTLEAPVTITNGEAYRIKVRQTNGTFVTYQFVSQTLNGEDTEEGNIVRIDGNVPDGVSEGLLGYIGPMTFDETQYRVMSITKGTDDGTIAIKGELYDEAIYERLDSTGYYIDDLSVVVSEKNYTKLGVTERYELDGSADDPTPVPVANNATVTSEYYSIPPFVTAVELEEINDLEEDKVVTSIAIDWPDATMPEGSLAKVVRYEVLHSLDGSTWEVLTSVKGSQYTYRNVARSVDHYFLIKPYTNYDKTNEIEASRYATSFKITPTGQVPTPDAVEGFMAYQNGDMVKFRWDEVTNTKIKYYEIREGKWALGKIVRRIKGDETAAFVGESGNVTYFIKAVNINGVYSTEATSFTVSIYDDGNRNIIFTKSDADDGWDGVKNNVQASAGGDLELPNGEEEGYYISGYIDLTEAVKCVNYVTYNLEAVVGNMDSWSDADYAWNDADAEWYDITDTDGVGVEHHISLFTELSDEFVDVVRLADKTESVRGTEATTAEGIEYASGTFHNGAVQQLGAMLDYDISFPENYSFMFRLRLGNVQPGYIAHLKSDTATMTIIMVREGVFWLRTEDHQYIEVSLTVEADDNLLFGIAKNGTDFLFFIGNMTKQTASHTHGALAFGTPDGFVFGNAV